MERDYLFKWYLKGAGRKFQFVQGRKFEWIDARMKKGHLKRWDWIGGSIVTNTFYVRAANHT